MRHLWSSVAGLVAAPVAWVLIALGQHGSARTISAWVQRGSWDTVDLVAPACYLAAAGILLGLLATLRVSPAGPAVTGVLFTGVYAAMFAAPLAVRRAVPADRDLFGEPLSLRLVLDNGTLLLVGVLLLMAVFSSQRWRRWPGAVAAPAAGEVAPSTPDAGPEPALVGSPGEPARSGEPAGEAEPEWASEPGSPASEPLPAEAPTSWPPPGGSGVTPGESPWLAPPRGTRRTGPPE